jgi:PAS domain-containing protein
MPKSFNLNDTNKDQLIQNLNLALASEEPVLIKTDDGSLPETWSNAARTRGWKDACLEAVVIPIQANRYHEVRGLLILGVATRSVYDAAYRSWIEDIRRMIGHSLNSVRRREVAAMQLAKREREAKDVSLQYRRLVKVMELSDVGVFECDREGNLLQANESWHRLSSFPRQQMPAPAFSWLEFVHDDDKSMVMSNWSKMLHGESVTVSRSKAHAKTKLTTNINRSTK